MLSNFVDIIVIQHLNIEASDFIGRIKLIKSNFNACSLHKSCGKM